MRIKHGMRFGVGDVRVQVHVQAHIALRLHSYTGRELSIAGISTFVHRQTSTQNGR